MTKLIYLTTVLAFTLSLNVGAQELDGTCWDHLSCNGTYWIETCFSNDTMTHTTGDFDFLTNYGIDATSGNLWVLDISGSCGQDTGWYSFEIIDGIMLFTSIDDPCAPREANLTCFVFMEQVEEVDVLDGTCWDHLSCDGTYWIETCFSNDTMTHTTGELDFLTNYGIDSTSGNLWVLDISGSCGQDTGWYSFEIIDGVMLFTSIDDPCAPREANLTCFVFMEQVEEVDVLDGTCWDHLSCDETIWLETCFSNDTMTSTYEDLTFYSSYGIDSVTGNFWIVDISGNCGQDTGWYSFEIIDGILLFTSIDDPCEQREANLTCISLIEQVVDVDELEGSCWDVESCDGSVSLSYCFENDTAFTTVNGGGSFVSEYGIDSNSGYFWMLDITLNCPDTGWYSFEIINDTLTFNVIDDQCENRALLFDCADFISTAVGISENDVLSEITIYPNPSQGQLNIKLDGLSDVSINVYSMDGKRIYHDEKINSTIYQFYLDRGRGVYIIELNANSGIRREKIIIQ